METVTDAALLVAAQTALGWVFQVIGRAPKAVPTWLGYVGLAVSSVGLFWFANRHAADIFHADWRVFLLQVASFFQAARGTAGMAHDTNTAPKTNTL